ncbi:MAG: carboxypeptidase-like regulatory domain-containing protein, partial [Acidobacteriaceae bacterium]
MKLRLRQLVNLALVVCIATVSSVVLLAQSETSSAISGTVTDSSGALIPNVAVTATETNTKAVRAGRTDAEGHYLFSQVNPGTYQVSVKVSGFTMAASAPTQVGVGRNVAFNFSLNAASANQTVEVSAQQGLLSLDNANTTTTIGAETIKNLPNPGQDLTYIVQFAQGALM